MGDIEAITHPQWLYITDIYTAKNIALYKHFDLLLHLDVYFFLLKSATAIELQLVFSNLDTG